MKHLKPALILLLALSTLALAACSLLPGTKPTPTPKPDEGPKPVIRGESVVVFGANNAFTLVYGAEEVSVGGSLAGDILNAVKSLGLKAPEFSADRDKPETGCELLIGNTSRALSAEAKAIVEENAASDPRGDHWILYYKDGQLAIYANNEKSYDRAIAELTDKFKAGEITVKKDLRSIGYIVGPHDAYMEYDVPDNFYDGYTDPFGMKDEDYKEMWITPISDSVYTISYYDDIGGCFSANFVKKVWGVWMMGAITYTDKNGVAHNMTSSSTDYEFVLRINGKGSSGLKSGNHGNYPGDDFWQYFEDDTSYYNDRLLDVTFYDAKSGEKLEFGNYGKSIKANGIRIVEHHNIYEFNYKQENVLANAERSYLYNGYDVMCDTGLYITQDVTMGGSYSAMLPISKQYGNCAMFYCEDGSTIFMKTPMSNTVNDSVYGANATYVDLWGENNPYYHMSVKIYNPEDQFMSPAMGTNKGYAGFREMLGGGSNKLYFQLFGTKGSLDWGEELHFNTCWTFSIQEDFRNPTREPDFWVGVKK